MNEAVNEGVNKLRYEIIRRAVKDYQLRVMRGKDKLRVKGEVKEFLNSNYCDMLLSDTDLDGHSILQRLEKWEKNYKKHHPKNKRGTRGYSMTVRGGKTKR